MRIIVKVRHRMETNVSTFKQNKTIRINFYCFVSSSMTLFLTTTKGTILL